MKGLSRLSFVVKFSKYLLINNDDCNVMSLLLLNKKFFTKILKVNKFD